MMKEFIVNILRGMVIGIANVIPGVSGGTMMVSMGIYDRLILVLTHFIKRMKEAIALLVPIGIGMLLSIAILQKYFQKCCSRGSVADQSVFYRFDSGRAACHLRQGEGQQYQDSADSRICAVFCHGGRLLPL